MTLPIINNASDAYRLQTGYENLGLSRTSTSLTVCSASGAALSASNCAYVTIPNASNFGIQNLYRITSNQTFTQSNIHANNFGVTNGVAWNQDMPFFLYYVANSAAGSNPNTLVTPMITRGPNVTLSPVAGKIGKTGSAVATTEFSMFALDSSITVADYASSPCIYVGWFRMQWLSSNDWTVSALSNDTGIGKFPDNINFAMPLGQNGAQSGSHFAANGTTAPTFSVYGYFYQVTRRNTIYTSNGFGPASVAGSGAGALALVPPYPLTGVLIGTGMEINAPPAVPNTTFIYLAAVQRGAPYQIVLYFNIGSVAYAVAPNSDITTNTLVFYFIDAPMTQN